MKKVYIFIFFSFFFTHYPLFSQITPNFYNTVDVKEMNEWVEDVFSTMTLDEKIGQLFMLVVDPNPRPAVLKIISGHIENYHIGGILFGKGNPENQVASTNHYQKVPEIPLMIALDGEWGLSMRLSFTTIFPKNMTIGAMSNYSLTELYGREVARQCKEMGIHINFAPVLDISSDKKNAAIGIRSFGDNPSRVSNHANAYARGLEKGGVMAVAKHFPGHGFTKEDSHRVASFIGLDRKSLENTSLLPFRKYIAQGFSGVMSGHFHVPALDSASKLPTSLSPVIITDLLQRDMGFSGLVFTDALVMRGANTERNICVQALLAGNDVLVSPPDIQRDFLAVKNAVKQGIISSELIERKCRKILEYKYMFGLHDYKPVKTDSLRERLNTPYAEQLVYDLYAQSLTLLKNREDILPLSKNPHSRVALLSAGRPADKDFSISYANVHCTIEEKPTEEQPALVSECIKNSDIVVCCIYSTRISEETILKTLGNGKKYVFCFFIPPYDLIHFRNLISKSDAIILNYENTLLSHKVLVDFLEGNVKPAGRLPCFVDGYYREGYGL